MSRIGGVCEPTWTSVGRAAASSAASATTPRVTLTSLKNAFSAQVCQPRKKGAPLRQCPCGRAKENREPKTRQLVSAVGQVSIRRRYWQCRCGTTDGAYAADALLGLDGRYSRTVQQHACRLGADQSFALAQEHLREMLDVRVSVET